MKYITWSPNIYCSNTEFEGRGEGWANWKTLKKEKQVIMRCLKTNTDYKCRQKSEMRMNTLVKSDRIAVFQSLSRVPPIVAPWRGALQTSRSFTVSQSLFRFMSTESVMPSNHLILCCPLLLPLVFHSIVQILRNLISVQWKDLLRCAAVSHSLQSHGL